MDASSLVFVRTSRKFQSPLFPSNQSASRTMSIPLPANKTPPTPFPVPRLNFFQSHINSTNPKNPNSEKFQSLSFLFAVASRVE